MANHPSSVKRNKQSQKRKVDNKYYSKTTRNVIKKLRATKEVKEATEMFPKTISMIDKLAKKNIIHKKKASNLKSKLAKQLNKLSK